MIMATPKEAVIANSRIIPISIDNKVIKPTVSESNAIPPGTSKTLKLAWAASLLLLPLLTILEMELII